MTGNLHLHASNHIHKILSTVNHCSWYKLISKKFDNVNVILFTYNTWGPYCNGLVIQSLTEGCDQL